MASVIHWHPDGSVKPRTGRFNQPREPSQTRFVGEAWGKLLAVNVSAADTSFPEDDGVIVDLGEFPENSLIVNVDILVVPSRRCSSELAMLIEIAVEQGDTGDSRCIVNLNGHDWLRDRVLYVDLVPVLHAPSAPPAPYTLLFLGGAAFGWYPKAEYKSPPLSLLPDAEHAREGARYAQESLNVPWEPDMRSRLKPKQPTLLLHELAGRRPTYFSVSAKERRHGNGSSYPAVMLRQAQLVLCADSSSRISSRVRRSPSTSFQRRWYPHATGSSSSSSSSAPSDDVVTSFGFRNEDERKRATGMGDVQGSEVLRDPGSITCGGIAVASRVIASVRRLPHVNGRRVIGVESGGESNEYEYEIDRCRHGEIVRVSMRVKFEKACGASGLPLSDKKGRFPPRSVWDGALPASSRNDFKSEVLTRVNKPSTRTVSQRSVEMHRGRCMIESWYFHRASNALSWNAPHVLARAVRSVAPARPPPSWAQVRCISGWSQGHVTSRVDAMYPHHTD
ncbi:hypothetical protein DFH09DRAFT_1076816 [Mycena vulgaris]|nr:hypothetical protein DFH09DRAFT_1076816 [Mycena vulgaris]